MTRVLPGPVTRYPSTTVTVQFVLVRPQIMTPAKKTTTTSADVGEKKKEYKYQQEISQMVRNVKSSPGPSNCFWLFAADVRLW
jgi:hypothetical protein